MVLIVRFFREVLIVLSSVIVVVDCRRLGMRSKRPFIHHLIDSSYRQSQIDTFCIYS
jgi:hypothetical protein